jgi:hypothetical protein
VSRTSTYSVSAGRKPTLVHPLAKADQVAEHRADGLSDGRGSFAREVHAHAGIGRERGGKREQPRLFQSTKRMGMELGGQVGSTRKRLLPDLNRHLRPATGHSKLYSASPSRTSASARQSVWNPAQTLHFTCSTTTGIWRSPGICRRANCSSHIVLSFGQRSEPDSERQPFATSIAEVLVWDDRPTDSMR